MAVEVIKTSFGRLFISIPTSSGRVWRQSFLNPPLPSGDFSSSQPPDLNPPNPKPYELCADAFHL